MYSENPVNRSRESNRGRGGVNGYLPPEIGYNYADFGLLESPASPALLTLKSASIHGRRNRQRWTAHRPTRTPERMTNIAPPLPVGTPVPFPSRTAHLCERLFMDKLLRNS